MVESTVPPVVWLGLIWSTWQIALRALSNDEQSKRHKALTTLSGYIVTWIMAVGLILAVIPSPTNTIVAVAISILYTLAVAWAYLGERIGKNKVPLALQGIRFLSYVIFATACVTEVMSLHLLYDAGYLYGAYDELLWLVKNLGWQVDVEKVLNTILPNALPDARTAVPLSLFGIALSTVLIALFAYRQGLIRGRNK